MIHTRALLGAAVFLAAAAAMGQATGGKPVRDLFQAYEYYEDSPGTRSGLPTILRMGAAELDYIRLRMRNDARNGFVMISRLDPEHWMGLEVRNGVQLVRIRDQGNAYNGRLSVNLATGELGVLRGVDYAPFNDTEDAAVTAHLALGYLRRAAAGGVVFPQTLILPDADLAALGVAGGVSGGAAVAPGAASGLTPMAPAPDMSPYRVPEGYLRLWSTAAVAAQELFGADKFGNDSLLETGDFAQAHLRYVDAQGEHLYEAGELEILVQGRVRAPENPLRMDELEALLTRIATTSGGLDLTIDSVRTSYYVPSTPPAPGTASGMAGAKDPALQTFEYLQALTLLSGDYNVVPQGALGASGLTQADLDLYWWARVQRAGQSSALYPPRVDSGGKLAWGDFALFATAKLKRVGVPSMIVIIRKPPGPSIPYHAVCLYQVGNAWRWMDSGRFGDQTATTWERLPALIYGKDVVFRVVDVATEWLAAVVDESTGWRTSRYAP